MPKFETLNEINFKKLQQQISKNFFLLGLCEKHSNIKAEQGSGSK